MGSSPLVICSGLASAVGDTVGATLAPGNAPRLTFKATGVAAACEPVAVASGLADADGSKLGQPDVAADELADG